MAKKDKKQRKEQKNNLVILILILGIAIGILSGIPMGMVMQQSLFTAAAVEVGESLEGTTFNVEIDFNETQLMDRMAEIMIPILNESYGVEEIEVIHT